MFRLSLSLMFVVGWGSGVQAQNIVVQQPAVQRFGVDTVVSVPDRGSAFIGGVSRAATSIPNYGPIPFGTSLGRSFSNSSVTTFVFIHDFELMDQMLLYEGSKKLSSPRSLRSSDPRVNFVLQNRTGISSTSLSGRKPNKTQKLDRKAALSILRNRR